jgi:two-component system phosphate regulon response regulator PhoB
LRLEPDTLRVFSNGEPVDLSPTEFRLLHFLMRHPDRVLSRSVLLDRVWGDNVYIEERTVDVHIRRLRLALTLGGHDRLIETVRGGGYRFLPQ